MNTRLPLAVLFLAWLAATTWTVAPPASRVDCYGDPLPPGALARMGTARFHLLCRIAISSDGKTHVAIGNAEEPAHHEKAFYTLRGQGWHIVEELEIQRKEGLQRVFMSCSRCCETLLNRLLKVFNGSQATTGQCFLLDQFP
jgi:hypothetical protein